MWKNRCVMENIYILSDYKTRVTVILIIEYPTSITL